MIEQMKHRREIRRLTGKTDLIPYIVRNHPIQFNNWHDKIIPADLGPETATAAWL